MTQISKGNSVNYDKKLNGVYYTPARVCTLVANWAIRASSDTVLEPSFGGCALLEAAYERLNELGAPRPFENLFGADIDPKAFAFLKRQFENSNDSNHFLQADFIKLGPDDYPSKDFHVVIANPPYISHHNQTEEQKGSCERIRKQLNTWISRRSSLWAYFVLHSLRFLKAHGRAVWILPGSFLYSDYSQQVRERVFGSFESVAVFVVREPVFGDQDAQELTVIVMADGYSSEGINGQVTTHFLHSVSELENALTGSQSPQVNSNLNSFGHPLVDAKIAETLEAMAASSFCRRLGGIGTIRIGTVTGDNSFFVLSEVQRKSLGLSTTVLYPAIVSSTQLNSVVYFATDHRALVASGKRCWVFSPSKDRLDSAVRQYLSSYCQKDVAKNITFQKRKIWHHPLENSLVPDAIISCTSHFGPKFVLNDTKLNCLNSVHQMTFNNKIEESFKWLTTISMHSTFTQIYAELTGKICASGALKLEPSQAKSLPLILPKVEDSSKTHEALLVLDGLVRNREFRQARKFSDRYIADLSSEYKSHLDSPEMDDLYKLLVNYRHGTPTQPDRHPIVKPNFDAGLDQVRSEEE